MPQQFLDHPEIGAALQKMSGKRMPQSMGGDFLVEGRLLNIPIQEPPHTTGGKAFSPPVQKDRFFSGAFALSPVAQKVWSSPYQVLLEGTAALFAQGYQPFFTALAKNHEITTVRIQIFQVQTGQFTHPDPGPVQQFHNRPVPQAKRGERR